MNSHSNIKPTDECAHGMRYESGCGSLAAVECKLWGTPDLFLYSSSFGDEHFQQTISHVCIHCLLICREKEREGGREGRTKLHMCCVPEAITNSQCHMHVNECHIPARLMRRNS